MEFVCYKSVIVVVHVEHKKFKRFIQQNAQPTYIRLYEWIYVCPSVCLSAILSCHKKWMCAWDVCFRIYVKVFNTNILHNIVAIIVGIFFFFVVFPILYDAICRNKTKKTENVYVCVYKQTLFTDIEIMHKSRSEHATNSNVLTQNKTETDGKKHRSNGKLFFQMKIKVKNFLFMLLKEKMFLELQKTKGR